jgi:hypothetical protein
LIAEAVAGLDHGALTSNPQTDRERDRQFFVMHDRLKPVAERRLKNKHATSVAGQCNE